MREARHSAALARQDGALWWNAARQSAVITGAKCQLAAQQSFCSEVKRMRFIFRPAAPSVLPLSPHAYMCGSVQRHHVRTSAVICQDSMTLMSYDIV